MKKFKKLIVDSLVVMFFVAVAMLTIKAVEWTIQSPPIIYRICIEDVNHKYHCETYETDT